MANAAEAARIGLRLLLVGVGRHLHADDLVGIGYRAAAGRARLDRVDEFHARGHLAENGVLAVEESRRREADEELAVAAVGALRARHADRAAQEMRLAELGRDVLARAAGAGAGGIAGLRHESRDDAVEDDAVVEAPP